MLEFVMSNAGDAASLIALPTLIWMVGQIKKLSGGTMASLKVQMHHLHDQAKKQIMSKHKIEDCVRESFWTAYKHYTNLNGNGRVKVWADDFERWQKNG